MSGRSNRSNHSNHSNRLNRSSRLSRPTRPAVRVALAAALCGVASISFTSNARAQDIPDAGEAAPRLPFGTAAVVLPVQSAVPSPAGDWPGLTASEQDAVRTMDAEIAFALAERRGAQNWALAEDLRERARRNPMLGVDPDRVAYQGLLTPPDRTDQLYEPLHGQLRALAALFGTRYVVLPLVLRAAPLDDPDGDREAQPEAADAPPCPDGAVPQRAELLVALIDIRRSAVLWHGVIRGDSACPDSGALLAGLAAHLAFEITDS